jgi:hypothetical protein
VRDSEEQCRTVESSEEQPILGRARALASAPSGKGEVNCTDHLVKFEDLLAQRRDLGVATVAYAHAVQQLTF